MTYNPNVSLVNTNDLLPWWTYVSTSRTGTATKMQFAKRMLIMTLLFMIDCSVPPDTIASRTVSPNGKFDAILLHSNGDATVSTYWYVSISFHNQPPADKKEDLLFAISHANRPSVAWKSNNLLLISAEDPKIWIKRSNYVLNGDHDQKTFFEIRYNVKGGVNGTFNLCSHQC